VLKQTIQCGLQPLILGNAFLHDSSVLNVD